jgi:hypothetical protein
MRSHPEEPRRRRRAAPDHRASGDICRRPHRPPDHPNVRDGATSTSAEHSSRSRAHGSATAPFMPGTITVPRRRRFCTVHIGGLQVQVRDMIVDDDTLAHETNSHHRPPARAALAGHPTAREPATHPDHPRDPRTRNTPRSPTTREPATHPDHPRDPDPQHAPITEACLVQRFRAGLGSASRPPVRSRVNSRAGIETGWAWSHR